MAIKMRKSSQRTKTARINCTFNPATRSVLEKLTRIQDRSMTNVLELLVMEKGREYGLIEAR